MLNTVVPKLRLHGRPGGFFGLRPSAWVGDSDSRSLVPAVVDWTVYAEELGFDATFVSDRLLSQVSGGTGVVYGGSTLDPFTLLATLAGRTSRLGLGTLVAVAPFRHPVTLAKVTASLDVASGGRFVFGAGAGWNRAELAVFGLGGRQGDRLESTVRTVRALWAGGDVTGVDGAPLAGARVLPRPVQEPGPPVWMASFAPDDGALWHDGVISRPQAEALRRVGRVADAWVPLTYSAAFACDLGPGVLAAAWDLVAEGAAAAGRDPGDIDIIHAHWGAVVRNAAERAACEAGLAQFFTGSWDDARRTYLIGGPEEILDRIRTQTARLPRVDGHVLTTLDTSRLQSELVASELRPRLVPARAATAPQREEPLR